MARTKKRRSSKRRSVKRRKHAVVARSNPPATRRSRRRHHRRNPFGVTGIVGSAMSKAKTGVVHGAAQVGGEIGARLVRSRVFGKPAGTMLSGAIEAATGIAAGLLVAKVLGNDIGQAVTDGAFAGVIRTAIKQSGAPIVAEILGDGGGRRRYVIRGGKVVALNGYVGNPGNGRLNGYFGNPGNGALNGYDEQDEIYGPN